jgi:hypothetical protein
MCEFSKENVFQNGYDEGLSPLSPLSGVGHLFLNAIDQEQGNTIVNN